MPPSTPSTPSAPLGPFRQRTDTRRASRTTRVHLSGVSWFGHVSLSCLSTFHLSVRPPVSSRFVTRVLWLFAHVAQNSVATCRRPVLTRGIVTHVHVSPLSFAMCRRLACDTCRFRTFPHVAILLWHMSVPSLDARCLRMLPRAALLLCHMLSSCLSTCNFFTLPRAPFW